MILLSYLVNADAPICAGLCSTTLSRLGTQHPLSHADQSCLPFVAVLTQPKPGHVKATDTVCQPPHNSTPKLNQFQDTSRTRHNHRRPAPSSRRQTHDCLLAAAGRSSFETKVLPKLRSLESNLRTINQLPTDIFVLIPRHFTRGNEFALVGYAPFPTTVSVQNTGNGRCAFSSSTYIQKAAQERQHLRGKRGIISSRWTPRRPHSKHRQVNDPSPRHLRQKHRHVTPQFLLSLFWHVHDLQTKRVRNPELDQQAVEVQPLLMNDFPNRVFDGEVTR